MRTLKGLLQKRNLQQLLQRAPVHVVNMAQPRVGPAVCAEEQHEAVIVVQHHIPRRGCGLHIVAGQRAGQGTHLLRAAICSKGMMSMRSYRSVWTAPGRIISSLCSQVRRAKAVSLKERVSRVQPKEMPEEIRRAFERTHEKSPCH